ncbi:MAG: multiheme c-type cytochrome [Vicinamibacteria bacterium]
MRVHFAWLVLFAVALLFGLLSAGSADPGNHEPSTLATQEPDPYVGNQMCVRCHEDVQHALTAVPHGSGEAKEIVENGCQSCHGPGRSHVQSPDNTNLQPSVERMEFDQQNQLCSGCHGDMPAFDRTHEVAKISCSSCHVLHERQPDMGVMRWQPNCLSCHTGSQAFDELHEYDLTTMATGEVSCRSCHQQAHGK